MSEAMQIAGNPRAFLAGRQNVLMGEPYVPGVVGWPTDNGDSTYAYIGTKCFDAGWTSAPVAKITIQATPGIQRSPSRFLPFQEDRCTYMEVDPAATTFFTSQLTGCNLYVCSTGGSIYVFHANANGTTGSNDANNLAKQQLAQRARTRVGGTSWDIALERGVQAFYPAGSAAGIFFGQKVVAHTGAAAWGFYFYTVDGTVHRLASSVAATNATL